MGAGTVAHRFQLQRNRRLARAGQPHASRQRRFTLLLAISALGSAVLGCGGDTTGPAPLGQTQTYWALQFNDHAVNMATTPSYNTVQLTATPVNAMGASLPDLGPVTYTAADSTVTVSPTGLVTARYVTSGTFVTATLQDRKLNLTHADTVFIQVTDTIPQHPLATFSIHPLPGDSAKRAVDAFSITQPVFATDAAGGPVCTATLDPLSRDYQPTCALQVYFTSSDPTVASIDRTNGTVQAIRPGHVTFYATTLAYGVPERDSLPFVIGWPLTPDVQSSWITPVASLTPVLAFDPPRLIAGVGATVAWGNQNPGDSTDVVFDDSVAVQPGCGAVIGNRGLQNYCPVFPPTGSGNIPPFALDTALLTAGDVYGYYGSEVRARSFPVAGTYFYHSRRYPTATGEIIVRTDP